MVEKVFRNREDVKKDMIKWGRINLGCVVIAMLLILAGVIEEAFEYDLILASISYYLIAIFFAIVSVAPHIQTLFDRQMYGIESEKK